MACRYREELVGKRFISVRSSSKLKINKISEWEWRSGIVRAVSTKDTSSLDLSVLVEFDDVDWTRREWIRVRDIFQLFLVEHTLVWAERPDPERPKHSIEWPGLCFRPVVDKVGLSSCKRKPVEFLVDRFLGLVEEKEIQNFQECEEKCHPILQKCPEIKTAIKSWLDYQDGQKILLTTPTVLMGYRVEVYRAEGTTQWYTAVIQSYNHTSKSLVLTDDTVLEEHNEDPCLVQMQLIDDGVVDSILRGVEIGTRRRPRQIKDKEQQQQQQQQQQSATNTKGSCLGLGQSGLTSRTSVRKSKQEVGSTTSSSPASGTSVSPAPTSTSQQVTDKNDKVGDKQSLRSRPQKCDRKRRLEDSIDIVGTKKNSGHCFRNRSQSEEDVNSGCVAKKGSDSDSVRSSVESTPSKTSLRTTPSKEANKAEVKAKEIQVDKGKSKTKEVIKEASDTENQVASFDSSPKKHVETAINSGKSRSPKQKDDKPLPSPVKLDFKSDDKGVGKIQGNSGKNKKEKPKEQCSLAKGSIQSENSEKLDKTKTKKPHLSLLKQSSPEKATKKEREEVIEKVIEKVVETVVKNSAENTLPIACNPSLSESQNSLGVELDNPRESQDNMHYIKKKQLLLTGGNNSSDKPPTSIPSSANIDVNHSVTDQIAKLTRTEKCRVDGEDKSSSTSASVSSSPSCDSSYERADRQVILQDSFRDYKLVRTEINSSINSIHNSNSAFVKVEERSLSRNSQSGRSSSGLSDEIRRSNSHLEDLRSSKQSPSSSPLIVDRSEPVHPYRDPELMRKNPVQSNVQSMLGSHKSSFASVHTPVPIPQQATGLSTSPALAHASSHTPVIPPVGYPPQLLSSMLPHGIPQVDQTTLLHHRLAQQQQLALAQYTSAAQAQLLSMSYPPHGNINSNQLELIWQQKYPSVPVPPPWLLAKHQEELVRDMALFRERELERERQERDRLERDRLERERLERERIERERRQERERQEKERLERERMEKEKAERERADRERIEKAEKERLERERRECERQEQSRIEQQRKERERLLKESADTLAAVDKHFSESLRLASQRAAQTGMWPAQSITLGTGKHKSESQPLHQQSNMYVHGSKSVDKDPKTEDKLKQDRLREQEYRYGELIRQQEMWRQRYHQEELLKHHQQLQQQQEKSLPVSAAEQLKTENKGDTASAALKSQSQDRDRDVKVHSYGMPSGVKPSYTTSTSSSAIKNDNAGKSHGFSLYGYQPFQHSYITTDQLHSYGLDKNRDDKSQIDNKGSSSLPASIPNSPQRKEMSNPPPLIKDNKQHSSVIVENKLKEALKSSSPQSSHYSPGMHGSSTSPRPAPKPAHSQERFVDKRPDHLPSSSPLGLSQLMSAHRSAEGKSAISSQSQSPLRVASPQQVSSAVMQPMDYRTNPVTNKSPGNNSNGSTNSSSVSTAANNVSSSGFVPAVAQPPVSLPPGSVAFTYSLIQQGLVPNPIYSHNSGAGSNKSGDSIRTISVAGTAHVPAVTNAPHPTSNTVTHSGAANQGTKRKNNKDGTNRKKQKGDAINMSPNSSSSGNISIPVTTPQILTNPSPYTTTTSSTVSPTSNTSMAATSTMGSSTVSSTLSSSSATASTFSPSSILSQPPKFSTFTGFMDSFKSFVENTVQNAFLQDPELNKKARTSPDQPAPSSSQPQQQQNQQQQQQQIPASQQLEQQQSQVSPHHLQLEQKQQQLKNKTGLERSSTPVSGQRHSGTPLSVNDDATNLSTASSSSHALSYVETISRVANGQIDTDSDTLSASSPPPQIKSEDNDQSPHKSAKHTKLKKAWLQRHSDEDKEMKNPPPNTTSPSTDEGKKDIVRNCYVDVSYINPGKEGGSKSPISSFVLPSNKQVAKMDESTSSASEAETTQVQQEGPNQAKKRKTKKERNASTKRSKFDSDETAPSNTRKKSNRRSRESKDKDSQKGFKDKETDNDDSTNLEEEEKDEQKEEMEEYSPPPLAHIRKDRSRDKGEGKQHRDNSSPTFDKNSDYSSFGKEKKKNKKNKDKDYSKDDQGSTKVSETARSGEIKSSSLTFSKPLVKASVDHLKKTGEPFLQDDSCSEVTPKLMKCRECKMTPTQRSKKLPNIFCRFYAFRRLRYSQRGFLTIDGFSELTDAEKDDIDPWIPHYPIMEPRLDLKTAKFILSRVGDKFCELVEQEKEAKSWAGEDAKIAWKRAVTGVREMCDVCDTTLFNMHWVCHKCGFVVCLDCYKVESKLVHGDKFVTREEVFLEERQEWLTCSANRQPHDVDKLMLTQIIPNDALWDVGCMVHEMRAKWGIISRCPCGNQSYTKNGISQSVVQQAMKHLSPSKNKKLLNGVSDDKSKRKNGNIKCSLSGYNPDNTSPLSLLADVASMDSENSRERSESPFSKKKEGEKGGKSYNPITEPVSPIAADHDGEKKPASCSTLRELLTKTAGKVKNNESTKKSRSKNSNTLDDIIQSVVEKQLPKEAEFISTENQPMKLMHYTPRLGPSRLLVRDMPILIHNLTETSVLYPEVPHSWLCDGRLLRLHDPRHKGNLKIFQEQWKRGQPVLASGCDKYLSRDLWSPKFFSKHFGSMENDLINCRTGCLVVGQPMKHFWDGFEDMEERLVDEQNNPMLLKLKDWPPGDDFSDILPSHFNDLMHGLPLPEYTHRNGCFNLASRLPDFLVRPDLGPKMYNAYGSADFPLEGTTNLHLDVSDAVNVMVYIGIPDDNGGKQQHMEAALKAIDEAECDSITKRRVREVNEVPGALWQIFDAVDADKIRDFLNKVAKERGEVIEEHHDPIHDQSWYLDVDLRERLYKEYNVLGYTIIQCMGDAIFIPAGAPHQVRNLNSCIKVAEDFVSPEHLNHCFQLTQEFRHLSDTHSNHEDKLQVKNIIYHAVKDACAVLNEFDPDDDDD